MRWVRSALRYSGRAVSAEELATAELARVDRRERCRCTAYGRRDRDQQADREHGREPEVEAGQLHRATTCLATSPAPARVSRLVGPELPGIELADDLRHRRQSHPRRRQLAEGHRRGVDARHLLHEVTHEHAQLLVTGSLGDLAPGRAVQHEVDLARVVGPQPRQAVGRDPSRDAHPARSRRGPHEDVPEDDQREHGHADPQPPAGIQVGGVEARRGRVSGVHGAASPAGRRPP